MIDAIDISNVLFLDIETVSGQASFDDLEETFQELWFHKAAGLLRRPKEELTDMEAASAYGQRAAIYAEFGKIICISVGFVFRSPEDTQLKVKLKSFAGHDEAQVLKAFADLITKYYRDTSRYFLCGHNIKEFDIPYICRRMVVHGIPLPQPLNLWGKKPWDNRHLLDTLELWRFGDNKNFTSLKLLAALLGFPSPKDDIDGSRVGEVYWEEQDLDRISLYCEKDVLATIQLFLRYRREALLGEEQVMHVR
jgi:DNA polymerase elongation subunit (family B)